ncbi:MAG: hypothetical protein KDD41_00660 [Flavobacteriales bacterium]|nr:hypothetical protein [Flavobacteriales bacterium]
MNLKPEPPRPDHLPEAAQWLSGQGAGVWFTINKQEEGYLIRRYAPEGTIDCERIMEPEPAGLPFDLTSPYRFVHISHCALCRIEQAGHTFVFRYAGETQ